MNLKGMFQQKSLGIQFALFLAITFISGIIFSVISYVLLPSLFNVSFFSLQSFLSDYSNQEAVNALKFLQLFSSIGLFIISPLLFSYLTYFHLNLNWQLNRRTILLGIVIMFLLNPLILFLYQWNQELALPDIFLTIEQWMKATEEKAMKLTEAFLRMENFNDLLINLLLIAIIPAIGEELLFRGVLQKFFFKWTGKIHWAIFVSAFLFSSIHLQFYGFLPRFILGLVLGYMFYWSGSLWIPILAHFTNNALAILFHYHLLADKIKLDFINNEIPVNINQAFFSFFAAGILLYLLKKSIIKS